jgi:hypothetical protein
MHSIFDADVVDVHGDMYRSWAAPDLYPDEPQPVVTNWHPEDQVAYCGGAFATAAYSK